MGTLCIFNIAEVKEPLSLTVKLANLIKFFLTELSWGNCRSKCIFQFWKLVSNLSLPGCYAALNLSDNAYHVSITMTWCTCWKQNGILKWTLKIMAVIYIPVIGHLNGHVAVCTVEQLCMLSGQECLHLRMLCLELLCSCSRLDPVVEIKGIIVLKDCLGCHGLYAWVRHHGFLVRWREIVLNVTLTARQGCRINCWNIASQCLVNIGVSNCNLATVSCIVAVAGIATYTLFHLCIDSVEIHWIDTHSLVIDHLCKVGSLACKAVCKGMGTCSCIYILKCILMAPGATVLLCKTKALVDVHKVGILLKIACNVWIFCILTHCKGNFRIYGAPIWSVDCSVLAGSLRSLNILVCNVFACKRTKVSPVFQMVHYLASCNSSNQTYSQSQKNHSYNNLYYLFLIHTHASSGLIMTLAGHFSAHLPHSVHFS